MHCRAVFVDGFALAANVRRVDCWRSRLFGDGV
jgi:hypothetical protein